MDYITAPWDCLLKNHLENSSEPFDMAIMNFAVQNNLTLGMETRFWFGGTDGFSINAKQPNGLSFILDGERQTCSYKWIVEFDRMSFNIPKMVGC